MKSIRRSIDLNSTTPPMQRMLEENLLGDNLVIESLTCLLIQKLEAQGAVGISEHVDALRIEIRKRHFNEDGLTWQHRISVDIPSLEGDFSVTIDQTDIDRLTQRMSEATTETVEKVVETLSSMTLDDVKRQADEAVKCRSADIEKFRSRLGDRWAKPLNLFALQLGIAIQFGGEISLWLRSQADKDDSELVDALLHLHARACQVAGEVEVLMQAGFADGALSRWRTLHEIATVALFIEEHGNEVAKRYIDHLTVDSYDLARKVRTASKGEGRDISDREMNELQERANDLKRKYGKEFLEEYGWAAATLSNPNPKFVHLEKAVSFERFRPYYKMASGAVHAGPKGAFWKLGLIGEEPKVLLAGPSNAGLAEAGRLTSTSLAHVSMALMMRHTVVDSTVWVRVLLELSHEIGASFMRVERDLESDEIEIQSNGGFPRYASQRARKKGRHEKLSARLRRRLGKW